MNQPSATRFQHQRHKPPTPLTHPRQLVVCCPQLRSNVNAARIIRAAGCLGIESVVLEGNRKLDADITRDALEFVSLRRVNSLRPVLEGHRRRGFAVIGVEQTTHSRSLFDFAFAERSVLVLGNERQGIPDDLLAILDQVVEIPVFGRPHSYNVATSAIMVMYEYCRQMET